MRFESLGVGFAAIAMLLPGVAAATTATTTMGVSANVQSACIVTSNNLSFGNYNPTGASPTDATTTFNVTCTTGTSFTVGLNAGTTSGATVTTRQMVNGASTLGYALYSDTSRTTNWGNSPGTDTPAATIAGTSASTFTIYGRIPAQQNVAAGAYTDTITITINY